MRTLLALPLLFHCFSLVLCSVHWATLERWKDWKKQYNQEFRVSADGKRRSIWAQNLALIVNHNIGYLAGHSRFTMVLNKFGALGDDEYIGMLGARMTPSPGLVRKPQPTTSPASLDYRSLGFVTPVKDQGLCGSSWAFSVTGAIEGQVAKTTGVLVSLSEQELIDCSKINVTYGCNGAWMGNAYKYIQSYGITGEDHYPYLARDDQPCLHDPLKKVMVIHDHGRLPPGDEKTLKNALASIGPITVAVDASNLSFIFYKSGIYDEPLCDASAVNHAILLVGYGSANGVDYWIIKNSWGPGWGEKGYMRLLRGCNLCGVASSALYPLL